MSLGATITLYQRLDLKTRLNLGGLLTHLPSQSVPTILVYQVSLIFFTEYLEVTSHYKPYGNDTRHEKTVFGSLGKKDETPRKTIEEFCPSKEGLQGLDFLQLFFAGTEDHACTEDIADVMRNDFHEFLLFGCQFLNVESNSQKLTVRVQFDLPNVVEKVY